MLIPTVLTEELRRNAPARDATSLIETALARRTAEERSAFWHAIDLAYVSRKAPDAPVERSAAGTVEADIAAQAIAAMA